jgi:4-hydroxythreonine-4-phosphate dehydrogenase
LTGISKIPPPLALTMGDPGGVGPELCAAAWRALREEELSFFVIANPDIFNSPAVDIIRIADPAETQSAFSNGLPVIPVRAEVKARPGVSSPENADAVIESITRAVDYAIEGAASGVVTNPIQKSSLYASGFHFPGHTEFLSALTMNAPMANGRTRGSVMMIAGPQLRTVPVTIHQSVIDAVKSLNGDLIVSTAIITAQALKTDFGIDNPRLAISGLNPHAGEKGALGAEDEMIIAPAVDRLKDMGLNVRGPLPADTMFHEDARQTYDAALCMLHDQALIPAKTINFHDAVNVTLGLPIIRTSPDHGTALDIAGKGVARPDSLIAAIRLAADMASRRHS